VIACPEIRELVLTWFGAIETGNAVVAADGMLTREPGFVAIGERGEWLDDPDILTEAYRDLAQTGVPRIEVLRLEAYREGTVGWAVDEAVAKWANGRVAVMRHTFVLHHEDGGWKVVHAHYSLIPSASDPG
jgi:ketosteroid isomerase-like protein